MFALAVPDSPFEIVERMVVPTSWNPETEVVLLRMRGLVEKDDEAKAHAEEADWHEDL